MTDDFEKPLKPRGAERAGGSRRRPDVALVLAIASCSILGIGALWALFVDDPLGGQPVATAAIERRAPERPTGADAPKAMVEPAAELGFRDGVPILRPGDPMPKAGPVIIRVPGAEGASVAAGRSKPGEVDGAMLEDTRYGALPRVAADGRRPADVYARPAASSGIKVALIVAGLGVSREATLEAVRILPPEVTLAFSPYGQDVGELVTAARADGHEALIQAPMEPFDYPANDPGPQTLLTGLPASANLERLRWSLGRAQGYAGVAPLGGARFLETEAALEPVFTELARRGLMFVAGGGGRPDRTGPAAQQAGLALARAVTAVDAMPDAAAIDAELKRLEEEAKAGRPAIGWASASPLTLKRIAAWASGLRARGVTLAPATASLGRQGPS
jgi:polysaccharide deacetylase 2 family uncharacterized protein YibQ